MKQAYLIILTLLSFALSSLGQSDLSVKQRLKIELSGLRNEISEADKTVERLRDDRATLEAKLQNMADWGVSQQKEKEQYYEETNSVKQKAAVEAEEANNKITELTAKIEVDLKKYHKLKFYACCVVGVALMLVYFGFSSTILAALGTVLGAWIPLLFIGGPVASFSLGYALIYFLF
jgi:hypothetical protein